MTQVDFVFILTLAHMSVSFCIFREVAKKLKDLEGKALAAYDKGAK